MWYGVSTMAGRLINYLLTPYLTYQFSTAQYGEMSMVYAVIPFLNVLFSYGMETAYFRFTKDHPRQEVNNTAATSLLLTTLVLTGILILLAGPLATLLQLPEHPEYLWLAAGIIATDALCIVPFAQLRQEGRPIRFAFIKIGGILTNIFFVIFFLSMWPAWLSSHPEHFSAGWYDAKAAVMYVLLANLIQNSIVLFLLRKQWKGFQFKLDKVLWWKRFSYGLPLIFAGLAGMVNETFDRIMLGWWAPVNGTEAAQTEVGIYSACYKLSILITLGRQAFSLGAEPFFFRLAEKEDAPKQYARVMKFFVITLCVMYLMVMLFLDYWKYFIQKPEMWIGLKVVPLLLLANIFLGVYYNLSVWYKLADKTSAGAWITFAGALITLVINYWGIPLYSYMACAWATLACYGSMMIISYYWGQKVYPIPYQVMRLLGYVLLVVLFGQSFEWLISGMELSNVMRLVVSTTLILLFMGVVILAEKEELKKIPLLKQWF
ncbi:MAG: oligosaccharide flippase family protein [Chitinophagaceae bacterium]|nr:oligosaccharide flippase family protein [Chitinophagaceae bacterium]